MPTSASVAAWTRRWLRRLEVPAEGGTVPNAWNNNDIRPIEPGRRTWTFWTFHNFSILSACSISTYMSGSALLAVGLRWWEALIAIGAGLVLATGFLLLCSLPGLLYHLGFPVSNRYVWGMWGATFVVANRILLSVVWYGFQSWIGGTCLHVCLTAIWPDLETRIPNTLPASTATTTASFMCYILFALISLPILAIRPHRLMPFLYCAAAATLLVQLSLLIWSLSTMGPTGFGDTLSSSPHPTESTPWLIAYGTISTLGSIAAGILSASDYTRFATRPRAALAGQAIGMPLYGALSAATGILVTAATQPRFDGVAVWNPATLLERLVTGDGGGAGAGAGARAAAFFGGLALTLGQLGLNVPGNGLSGGFDLAALAPRWLNIRRGAYLTAALSVACCPWTLVESAGTFVAVLSAYAVFLGPMVGLMAAAFGVVQRGKVCVPALFEGRWSEGVYWFGSRWGVDWRAVVGWLLGTSFTFPGFLANVAPDSVRVAAGWTHLYQLCFLVGFAVAFTTYCALHWAFPDPRLREWVKSDESAMETIRRFRKEGGGVEEVEERVREVPGMGEGEV